MLDQRLSQCRRPSLTVASRSRAKLLLGAAIVGAGLFALPPTPTVVQAAGAQSCNVGDSCVTAYCCGSIYYGWTGSDSSYFGNFFSSGYGEVANNTGLGRNRDQTYQTVCYYYGTGYTSYADKVSYYGVTWDPIPKSLESHYTTTGTSCAP